MNFDEFVNEVKDRVKDFLPADYADASVEVMKSRKLNHTSPALVVKKEGQEFAPSIDLDQFFQELEHSTVEEVLERVAELAQRKPDGIDKDELGDYDRAKERLFIRVSNAETNRELLKIVPHKEILDLAVTCHILVESEDGEVGSMMVNNDLRDKFGVTTEQLFEDAFLSSPAILPPSIKPMEAMIGMMLGYDMEMGVPAGFEKELEGLDLVREGMAVLTNDRSVNGAAVILYPGVLEQIGESQKVDMFILPSSTHEVILVPDNGTMRLEDLEDMVRSINAAEVAPQDRLSDTVYHYDHKARILERGSDFADRMNRDAQDLAEEPKTRHKKEKALER